MKSIVSVRYGGGLLLSGVCFIAATAPVAFAGVQEFEDEQRPDWFAAAGAEGTITTIDFTGLAFGEFVTDQFEHLGVTFSPGDDQVFSSPGFLQDGWGIDGQEYVRLLFDEPQFGIGIDFPGTATIDLYLEGTLVFSSKRFGTMATGNFGGIIGVSFDEAIIDDWADGLPFIDDIHFVSIPVPSTMLLVAFIIPFHVTRRRAARR